jgi:cell division protein ZapA (FtsZ GTPase activity inhibitor)
VPTSSLRIEILGTSFFISADEEPGYLEKIFTRYCVRVENVQKITGVSDPLKLAIITGFLLCEDIQKYTASADSPEHFAAESKEAERIFTDINTRIDEILDTEGSSKISVLDQPP